MKLRTSRKKRKPFNEFLEILFEESDTEENSNKDRNTLKNKSKKVLGFECKMCCKKFSSKYYLERHKRKNECEDETSSELEDEDFKPQIKAMKKPKKESVKTENNEKSYFCRKCPMSFTRLKDLREHRKAHSLKEFIEDHTYSFDEVQEIYICNTCSAEFKDQDEVEKHTKTHIEIFECSHCEDKFQTLLQLGSHIKTKHNNDDEFVCPLCPDQKFPKTALFIKHIDMKHQKRYTYTCKDCGKGFLSRTLCNEHSNIHKGVKPFACVVCGARFTYSKSVTTHQLKSHRVEILGKSHSTECTYCKNRFISIASLERHMQQVHEKPKAPKEKIHLCDVCGMGFVKKNKLVIHQRVHTGDRPYPCRYCDKSFSKSGERNCHERIHTGERPYSCEYCGKSFRQSAPFKVHIRSHTGERPYVCDICTKGFTTNQGLKLHRKNCGNMDLKNY